MSTAGTHITIDGKGPYPGNLTIDIETIDISSETATIPDITWQTRDQHGHFHAYDHNGNLPTLVARSRHVACTGSCGDEDDCEGYDVTEHFCAICDEPIEPGRVRDNRRYAPGREDWSVNVTGVAVPIGRVSVYIVSEAVVYFGVARCVSATSAGSHLVADSPLGRRDLGRSSK